MSSGLAPGLLIAAPQLLDSNFVRTVVLLLHHDESGAMGIVLNRPLELPLREVARQHGIDSSESQGQAFFGGPVEVYRGFVLHAGEQCEDDTEIFDGVQITGSVSVLKRLLEASAPSFRLYLGYAGWGPGQLDAELTAGAWLAGELSPRYIFEVDADDCWDTVLADMGIDPAMVLQSTGEIA